MDAKKDLDLIDQYIRKQLTGERLALFEVRLQKDPHFSQEVELQRKIIQAIRRAEVRNILWDTHQEISDETKSNLQKAFEKSPNVSRYKDDRGRKNRIRKLEELRLSNLKNLGDIELIKIEDEKREVLVPMLKNEREEARKYPENVDPKNVDINYEGDTEPPFRFSILSTSGKAKLANVKIYPPFYDYNFHYYISIGSGYSLFLKLYGDFDPEKLTLVYHKKYNLWSVKLRVGLEEYNLDEVRRITPLSK